jgi:hypothetical protein
LRIGLSLLSALLFLLSCTEAAGEPPRQITKRTDPLVRTLEALYAKSMEVALTGDLDAYGRFRTAASRERPPQLTAERLPLFAQMLPPLSTLQFVRMDTAHGMARVLYRWPRNDMIRYTIVVYRTEPTDWKIDSIVVKTDVVSNPREAQIMEDLRRRAAAAEQANQ